MSAIAAAEPPLRPRSLARLGIRRFARRPAAVAALVVLLVIFVLGLLAPLLGGGWDIIALQNIKAPPSGSHVFGTDGLGRDVLKRTLYGIRTTEEIALAGAALATLVGLVVGGLAGYYGRWIDAVAMRLADIVTAYPAVIFALAAIVYFAPILPHSMILVYATFMWAIVARAVRADIVRLRETEYVEAARALGASDGRILVRHLLPNVIGTVVVASTSLVGLIVLVDATVEFFGFGFPSEVAPSLGNLVADTVKFKFGLSNDTASYNFGWWTWFFPGLILVAILVCVNVVGDALDEALNPRRN